MFTVAAAAASINAFKFTGTSNANDGLSLSEPTMIVFLHVGHHYFQLLLKMPTLQFHNHWPRSRSSTVLTPSVSIFLYISDYNDSDVYLRNEPRLKELQRNQITRNYQEKGKMNNITNTFSCLSDPSQPVPGMKQSSGL